jgi:hypothetical protein
MKASQAELEALAGRLRTQVAEGRYPVAQGALQEYCRALRKTVAGLPPGDPGLRCLEDEWQRLLDETRRRVLAGRAHACARLVRLPKPLPNYYSASSLPRHTWECSG